MVANSKSLIKWNLLSVNKHVSVFVIVSCIPQLSAVQMLVVQKFKKATKKNERDQAIIYLKRNSG